MLTIEIPLAENFDDSSNEFVVSETFSLNLEHSLVSVSKWESFFEKAFLSEVSKTPEETFWYVKAMTTTQNVPESIYNLLTKKNVADIEAYIGASMTATTFPEQPGGPSRGQEKIITSELIYYWMIALNVPFECQYWHLNRLMTLIRICNIKNAPPKKQTRQSRAEMVAARTRLNAERKAQLGTTG